MELHALIPRVLSVGLCPRILGYDPVRRLWSQILSTYHVPRTRPQALPTDPVFGQCLELLSPVLGPCGQALIAELIRNPVCRLCKEPLSRALSPEPNKDPDFSDPVLMPWLCPCSRAVPSELGVRLQLRAGDDGLNVAVGLAGGNVHVVLELGGHGINQLESKNAFFWTGYGQS